MPAADTGVQKPSDEGLAGRAVAGSLWLSDPSGTALAPGYTASPPTQQRIPMTDEQRIPMTDRGGEMSRKISP